MRTIMIMLDTLNRRALSAYGGEGVRTPNIDRLAEQSVVFDQHWSGSLPCMPARRDMLTGRAAFLEKGWGGIEPFDRTLPAALREDGVFSHIVTDHYHYFATGGENYCQSFSTWDFHRGQEDDPWVSSIKDLPAPERYYGQVRAQCEKNRTQFLREEDYPGPRTIQAACGWLEKNGREDRYFLTVEAFDPHEPFDTPDHYLQMYQDSYEGPAYSWPKYGTVDVPPEALAHIQKRYAATLTMIDHWLGKLLDTMERLDILDDTLVIFTTDHGLLLGEHEQTGKNVMHVYNELANIPLMIRLPEGRAAGTRIQALTQNIDLMPTILDYMGASIPETVQGASLRGLLEGTQEKVREAALYGYHGMCVNVTDGRYTYMRAPVSKDNYPCYAYTAMPTTFRSYLGRVAPERIEAGRFLPYTAYPVFKIPESTQGVTYARNQFVMETRLYDLARDEHQEHPLQDDEAEARMIELLVAGMKQAGAPEEQYVRLGLLEKE
ncbi:sulfatase [Paenibacillus glycanilyticus]|uniref:Sulfatase n=1 Tax=Paenibacillus glycanilyticus TaxID=126569 RepID=A0ABQ6NPM2_9BACL|nr:sulfatase [Paenibacillus glycanilyticus]GMK45944.1 sulfatase [Paenibacillus glycanilyticus]